MRIISGKYKGHKLVSFDEDHIRPTTDRVKGSLYNIVAAEIEGAKVLDLFSGSGSLGLEAFSRGASTLHMVELNPRSIQIIKKNLEILKINDGVKVFKSDAVDFVNSYSENEAYDIILIDPPFPLKICKKILECISESAVAGGATQIVIEHSKHEPLPDTIQALTRIDSRNYGDKLLSFYKKG